ncbi:hypothetical protein JHK87_055776 [Glycine soja]|nr:hypothetical protein JHK87_055776 [Glycine soja]
MLPIFHKSFSHPPQELNSPTSYKGSKKPKLLVVMSLERHDTNIVGFDTKNTVSYAADASNLHVEEKKYSYSTKDGHDAKKIGFQEATHESVHQPKRTAKIHDFYLGIPFAFDESSLS